MKLKLTLTKQEVTDILGKVNKELSYYNNSTVRHEVIRHRIMWEVLQQNLIDKAINQAAKEADFYGTDNWA